jgi:hypothetical protein
MEESLVSGKLVVAGTPADSQVVEDKEGGMDVETLGRKEPHQSGGGQRRNKGALQAPPSKNEDQFKDWRGMPEVFILGFISLEQTQPEIFFIQEKINDFHGEERAFGESINKYERMKIRCRWE